MKPKELNEQVKRMKFILDNYDALQRLFDEIEEDIRKNMAKKAEPLGKGLNQIYPRHPFT